MEKTTKKEKKTREALEKTAQKTKEAAEKIAIAEKIQKAREVEEKAAKVNMRLIAIPYVAKWHPPL